MKQNKALEEFGRCYNKGDFNGIEAALMDNIVYDSYDCIYKITNPEEVIKVLNQSIPKNTSAYNGFYLHRGIAFKRLQECILICDDETLKCIKIVNIKLRRGKIATITGYQTKEINYNRGKKIGV